MRFLISVGLIVMLVPSAFAGGPLAENPANAPLVESKLQIDRIVTGIKVSATHHAAWLRTRKRLLACGKCAATQPFPGEDID